MKKIPKKNYVIASLIIVVTFIITVFCCKFYLNQKELSKTSINLNLSEIKVDELDNYIVDNHDVMIYIIDSSNKNGKIEKSFNKIIIKNNYGKDIVYLDLNNIDSTSYQNFVKKYNNSNDISSETLIIFKDEKITRVKKITENNVKNIKEYIDRIYYEV